MAGVLLILVVSRLVHFIDEYFSFTARYLPAGYNAFASPRIVSNILLKLRIVKGKPFDKLRVFFPPIFGGKNKTKLPRRELVERALKFFCVVFFHCTG